MRTSLRTSPAQAKTPGKVTKGTGPEAAVPRTSRPTLRAQAPTQPPEGPSGRIWPAQAPHKPPHKAPHKAFQVGPRSRETGVSAQAPRTSPAQGLRTSHAQAP